MKPPRRVLCSLLITTLMVITACGSAPQSTQPTASLPVVTQPNPTAQPPTALTASPSALQQALAGSYKGKIVSAINVGKGPDVEEFTSLVALRSWAKQGKLVDMNTFIDMTTLRERYDQDVLDWATVDGPDGPIMAGVWSMSFTAGVVWYPKAAFDKAGYQVPDTWSALVALSDRIVKDGGTPWCIENGGDGYTPTVVTHMRETARKHTSGAIGANFLMAGVDPALANECVAAAARSAQVVDFFWGDPDPVLIDTVHAARALAGRQPRGSLGRC